MSKEGDKILWRGVRPTTPEAIFTRYEKPEGCTYAYGYGKATNASVTIYTVPDNTIFYLTSWGFSLNLPVTGRGVFRIFTDAAATYISLLYVGCLTNEGRFFGSNLNIAMQIPAKYYIQVIGDGAGVEAYGWVVGYTRPV